MITTWILKTLGFIATGALSLFPTLPEESVSSTVASSVAGFMAGAAKLGVWIPWGAILPAFGIVSAIWLATAGITLIRRIISHVTGGGGAIG